MGWRRGQVDFLGLCLLLAVLTPIHWEQWVRDWLGYVNELMGASTGGPGTAIKRGILCEGFRVSWGGRVPMRTSFLRGAFKR